MLRGCRLAALRRSRPVLGGRAFTPGRSRHIAARRHPRRRTLSPAEPRQEARRTRVPGAADLASWRRPGQLRAQDELARDFAREHSERLWKQLVVGAEPTDRAGLWPMLGFAAAAGLAVMLPLRITGALTEPATPFVPLTMAVVGLADVLAGACQGRDGARPAAGVMPRRPVRRALDCRSTPGRGGRAGRRRPVQEAVQRSLTFAARVCRASLRGRRAAVAGPTRCPSPPPRRHRQALGGRRPTHGPRRPVSRPASSADACHAGAR